MPKGIKMRMCGVRGCRRQGRWGRRGSGAGEGVEASGNLKDRKDLFSTEVQL